MDFRFFMIFSMILQESLRCFKTHWKDTGKTLERHWKDTGKTLESGSQLEILNDEKVFKGDFKRDF